MLDMRTLARTIARHLLTALNILSEKLKLRLVVVMEIRYQEFPN